jgi:hypothetical protein
VPDTGGIRTADPKTPGSWNRYVYTYGDPVNFYDPRGLLQAAPGDGTEGGDCEHLYVDGISYGCIGGGGGGSEGGGGDDEPPDPSPAPCHNWGCMPPAFARAMQALTLNQDCLNLYGTAQTRTGRWDPAVVLTSLFLAQDGTYGSANCSCTNSDTCTTSFAAPVVLPSRIVLSAPTVRHLTS